MLVKLVEKKILRWIFRNIAKIRWLCHIVELLTVHKNEIWWYFSQSLVTSREWYPPLRSIKKQDSWARICKRLWSPGFDSGESIPPAYVAWRDGTTNRVVVPVRQAGNRFLGSWKGFQIRAQLLHKNSHDNSLQRHPPLAAFCTWSSLLSVYFLYSLCWLHLHGGGGGFDWPEAARGCGGS